jgi:hypothetical protein
MWRGSADACEECHVCRMVVPCPSTVKSQPGSPLTRPPDTLPMNLGMQRLIINDLRILRFRGLKREIPSGRILSPCRGSSSQAGHGAKETTPPPARWFPFPHRGLNIDQRISNIRPFCCSPFAVGRSTSDVRVAGRRLLFTAHCSLLFAVRHPTFIVPAPHLPRRSPVHDIRPVAAAASGTARCPGEKKGLTNAPSVLLSYDSRYCHDLSDRF